MRRDVIALVVDDQVLFAIGNGDTSAIIDVADVARVQPTVLYDPVGLRLVPPIALHHQRTAHKDLAIFGNLDLSILQRRANGIHLDARLRPVAADDGARLGLPVPLQQSDAQGLEKHANVGVERRTARYHGLHPAAKAPLNFRLNRPR